MNARTTRNQGPAWANRLLRGLLPTVLAIPLLLPATPARAAEEPFAPVVLIPPFTSSAHSYTGGPHTDAARERLEDVLVNKNVKVVERSRIDRVLKEAEFSGKSAMTDSQKAVKAGQALGANIIVMGTILDVTTERTKFNDAKIHTEKTTVKAGVRIRVVDMNSGTITFSKEFDAEDSYDSSSNGSKSSSDATAKVIKKAIVDAGESKEFLAAINTRPAATTPATGKPTPAAPVALPKGEWFDAMAAKDRAQWASPPGVKNPKGQVLAFNADGSVTVEGQHLWATEFADGRIKATFGKMSEHPLLFLRHSDSQWYGGWWDSDTKTCGISLHVKGAAPRKLITAKRDLAPAKHDMEFSAVGQDLILSIDGKEVARAKDSTLDRGKPGLGGNSRLWDVQLQVSN